jgi:hypothetical protein
MATRSRSATGDERTIADAEASGEDAPIPDLRRSPGRGFANRRAGALATTLWRRLRQSWWGLKESSSDESDGPKAGFNANCGATAGRWLRQVLICNARRIENTWLDK